MRVQHNWGKSTTKLMFYLHYSCLYVISGSTLTNISNNTGVLSFNDEIWLLHHPVFLVGRTHTNLSKTLDICGRQMSPHSPLWHTLTESCSHIWPLTSLAVTISVILFFRFCFCEWLSAWNRSGHNYQCVSVYFIVCLRTPACANDSSWCKSQQTFLSEVISVVVRP